MVNANEPKASAKAPWTPVTLGDLDSERKDVRKTIGFSELGRVGSFVDILATAARENDTLEVLAVNSDAYFAERIEVTEKASRSFRNMLIARCAAYGILVGGSVQTLVMSVRSFSDFVWGSLLVFLIAVAGYWAIVKSPTVKRICEWFAGVERDAMLSARVAWAISDTKIYMASTDRAGGNTIIRDLSEIIVIEDGDAISIMDGSGYALLTIERPTYTNGMYEQIPADEALGIFHRKLGVA